MWIIGIIGDIAAGKSTVALRLQSLGATWIDADLIARTALQSDWIRPSLMDALGKDIIANDGTVDRQAVAKQVFGHDETSKKKLLALESIVHPIVRQAIRDRLIEIAGSSESKDSAAESIAGFPIVVLDVPLLIESGWVRVCDEVWLVTADWEVRRSRAHTRGWSDQELERRTAAQIPTETKRRHAHRIIQNDGNLCELHEKIEECLREGRLDEKKFANLSHCRGQKWPPIV